MRGHSIVVFRQGEKLGVDQVPSDAGPVNIGYTSRWSKRSEGIVAPGHLWIEIRGNGPNLESVMNSFANAALICLPILAIATNAAIEEPELELAFESTPGVTQREYFQSFLAPEGNLLHSARFIDVQDTLALIHAVINHSEGERILRAISQYNIALRNWKFGHSTLSVVHLWVALEALTKVKLRAERSARGLSSDEELAKALGVEKKDLDPAIRRQLLQGDGECYTAAKKASDGFEHGFLAFDRLLGLSQTIRKRMAAYVRQAIFDLAGVEARVRDSLLSQRFADPIGPWPHARYLRGVLKGEGDDLAPPENEYPFIKWRSSVSKLDIRPDGKMDVEFQEQLTPELAKGIEFVGKSVEIWEAN